MLFYKGFSNPPTNDKANACSHMMPTFDAAKLWAPDLSYRYLCIRDGAKKIGSNDFSNNI